MCTTRDVRHRYVSRVLVASALALVTGHASVAWAQPTFGPPIGTPVVETEFQQNLPALMAAGDFNEDGILDVVVTSGGEDVHIMLGDDDGQGNGDGSFTQHDVHYEGDNPGDVTVGDVDNDNNLDIVWSDNANDGSRSRGAMEPAALPTRPSVIRSSVLCVRWRWRTSTATDTLTWLAATAAAGSPSS